MAEYDVIIIGAGIGGLTAGNILAKNGKKVLILEKNPVPGGAVSTFWRNGYPIDISHALCAVSEGAFIRNLFDYLDIYKRLEFIELEKAFVYLSPKRNKPIFCFTDTDAYIKELVGHFPEEETGIKRFFSEITKIWKSEVLKSYYDPSLIRLLAYPFVFNRLFRFQNYTFDQFLNRFTKNEELKDYISAGWPYLGLERNFVSALYMICLMGAYHKDKGFFIRGGLGKICEVMADKFKENRGDIKYGVEVKRIIVRNKRAMGVEDAHKNSYFAAKIISNIDSRRTFSQLLDGKIVGRRLLKKVKRLKPSCSAIQVHIAVAGKIPKEYLSTGSVIMPFNYDLESGLKKLFKTNIQTKGNPILLLSIHPLSSFEKSTEDEDIYILNVLWFTPNYQLWRKMVNEQEKAVYENIRKEAAQSVIEELKKTFAINEVRFYNVLTPISMEKWLNSYNGAIYDMAVGPNQSLLKRMKNKTPVRNLYLVGAKTFPGPGMAGALTSAVSLSDILLNGKLTKRKLAI
jgi:prolycopene isomerase